VPETSWLAAAVSRFGSMMIFRHFKEHDKEISERGNDVGLERSQIYGTASNSKQPNVLVSGDGANITLMRAELGLISACRSIAVADAQCTHGVHAFFVCVLLSSAALAPRLRKLVRFLSVVIPSYLRRRAAAKQQLCARIPCREPLCHWLSNSILSQHLYFPQKAGLACAAGLPASTKNGAFVTPKPYFTAIVRVFACVCMFTLFGCDVCNSRCLSLARRTKGADSPSSCHSISLIEDAAIPSSFTADTLCLPTQLVRFESKHSTYHHHQQQQQHQHQQSASPDLLEEDHCLRALADVLEALYDGPLTPAMVMMMCC